MAPKQAKENENPPMVSSSEEEEEQTVSLPERSTAKRYLKKSDAEDSSKKKMKTVHVDQKQGKEEDETKNQIMFQRIFSEDEGLALLQGILDFTSEEKQDPFKEKDAFCNFVKKFISFDAIQSQIATKVRNLKRKFEKAMEKSLRRGKGGEKEIVFSKDVDQKAFELSRQIWGSEGVWASKSKKKLGGKQEAASTSVSSGGEIVSFLKAENVTSFALDESTMLAGSNMVRNGPKKRKMVEKQKKVKAMYTQLCSERAKCAIFKEVNIASSNGNAQTLSQNEKEVESKKETDDGSKNGEILKAVDQEEKDVSVEQLETDEGKTVEVSADGKHNEPKESDHDIEMQEKEVDVVSGDTTNIEKENEAYVPSTVIENTEGSRTNPRKKLLVLDLNGLLADIVSPRAGQKPDICIGRRAIFKRPFVEEFLKFCFEKFEVGIWSPRKKKNVTRTTEFLLGDLKSKLLFCWDMSYCAITNVGCLENNNKPVVFKELNMIWETNGDYDQTNTVLLDNSPYKALLNPPYTAIFPHSYNHQNKTTDTSLGNGGDLRVYLEKLVQAENVQEFIMKNPFVQEAITKASESWKLYKGAIPEHMNAS